MYYIYEKPEFKCDAYNDTSSYTLRGYDIIH